METFELLVGAGAFMKAADADLRAASRRVLVQAMTFEGDEAGQSVAAAIRGAGAPDRRVLVDAFSRYVISDRFVRAPHNLLDAALRAEVRATRDMFAGLVRDGVGVRVTNPVGPLLCWFAARNHKKLVIADDAAYLGGINFSDHNFGWHDLMVRIADKAMVDFLAQDFEATWNGRAEYAHADFGAASLRAFDGRTNAARFGEVITRIERAERRIAVVSPYLTFPFVAPLQRACRRGVTVELFTPAANNKRLVADYLLIQALDAGFALHLMPGMSHLKGMLIDDRELVLGSSNFDFVSYHAHEEYVMISADPGLVGAFREQVLAPARASSTLHDGAAPRRLAGAVGHAALRLAEIGARASRRARRSCRDWAVD